MPGGFDPYHKWLGIPPEDQPPHHYRLLALSLFEDDPDVIEAAADQRMMLLRTYQTGPRSALSQRLLNEVAAAKVCLLNDQTKGAYDKQLREELAAGPEATPPQAPPPVASDASAEETTVSTVSPRPAPEIGAPLRPSVQPRRTVLRLVPLLVVALAVAAVLSYAYWTGKASRSSAMLKFDWPENEREGATLVVGDHDVDVPRTGPVEHACEPGTLQVFARRPGYRDVDKTVEVQAGEHKRVQFDWRLAGSLLVFDWPTDERADGQLLLDGEPVDLPTPRRWMHAVEPGMHEVVASRAGFESIRREVVLQANQEECVQIGDWHELSMTHPKDGDIELRWPEQQRLDAELLLDGELVEVPATGPCRYALSPGEHRVEVRREGFEPFGQPVEVAAEADVVVIVELVPQRFPEPSLGEDDPLLEQLDARYAVAAAQTQQQRRDLAARLFEEQEGCRDEPEQRFAMLLRALELAARGHDVPLVQKIVEATAASYLIDTSELGVRACGALGLSAETTEQHRAVAEECLRRIDCCRQAERPDCAEALAEIAFAAASRSGSGGLLRLVAIQILEMRGELTADDVHYVRPPEEEAPERFPPPEGDLPQKEVWELFGDEIRRAQTPREKVDLAVTIYSAAKTYTEGAAIQYELLGTARDLSAEVGDLTTAWSIIDDMGGLYEVDGLAMKAAALPPLGVAARSTEQISRLAAATLALVEEALARDDHELAAELAERGVKLARKTGYAPLVQFAVERRKEVSKIVEEYPTVQDALAAVSENPLDPDAKGTVGEYCCLVKGAWDGGVAMLSLGSEGALKVQAVQDLADASSPESRKEIGDGWWGLSEEHQGRAKRQLQARAVYWYRLALPGLRSSPGRGAAREDSPNAEIEVVESRIAAYEAAEEPPFPPPPPPVPGRVYVCCDNSFEMYVNGSRFFRGSGVSAVHTQDRSFASGDVITVLARDTGSQRGFCCVIVFQNALPIRTGPVWKAYRPKDESEWFKTENIEAVFPVYPTNSKPTEGPSKYVYGKCGVAAPAIWAQGDPNPCYLVLTIP